MQTEGIYFINLTTPITQKNARIYCGEEAELIFQRLNARSNIDVSKPVGELLAELDLKGFRAVVELTKKFDKFDLNPENIRIGKEEIAEQAAKITKKQKESIDESFERVYSFQKKVAESIIPICEEKDRRNTKLVPRPIERVGIWIPGGLAPLPSSLLMAGATARAAGVKSLIGITPPRTELNPAVAYILQKLEIKDMFRMGGVPAIWAMANGLAPYFEKVDMVCGPGNMYVAEAKRQVRGQGKVGIDLDAGPSEVLILADETANSTYVAADMLAQAEHGPTSPGILITDSERIAKETQEEIGIQLTMLKRGMETEIAIQEYGGILLVRDFAEALNLANQYASEHLEIFCSDETLEKIRGSLPPAGAVFIRTGEAFADYGFTGGNHILPTGGSARFSSGLSALSFITWQYQEEMSEGEQKKAAEGTGIFADIEGLEAHANAARIRDIESKDK
ncbi:MAG: histidinol dehydrogenase [Candidatus Micrarchaeota archaeon]